MATRERPISPVDDGVEEEASSWRPNYYTTEESFYGWGGTDAEEAVTKEFLHNLLMARGPLDLPTILGLVSRVYAEIQTSSESFAVKGDSQHPVGVLVEEDVNNGRPGGVYGWE